MIQAAAELVTRWRQRLGVLAYDWRPYMRALRKTDRSWISLCNRDESVTPAPGGEGVRCEWQWSSELHAARVFPSLGLGLMRRATDDYPVVAPIQCSRTAPPSRPTVSFVITHKGRDRLPLLLRTVNSIGEQSEPDVECVVVEQSIDPEAQGLLPPWVRYVHAPPDDLNTPFCKSKAYNIGARIARADVLILHDGDILVPVPYAREVCSRVAEGYETIDLKRFVFYLSEAHTLRLLRGDAKALDEPPELVVQNVRGGTVAVTREAFEATGGFDEDFLGWGGEDVEFWERARTRRAYEYPCLPFIHLWHTPQPEKNRAKSTPGMALFQRLSAVPATERIRALRERRRNR